MLLTSSFSNLFNSSKNVLSSSSLRLSRLLCGGSKDDKRW